MNQYQILQKLNLNKKMKNQKKIIQRINSKGKMKQRPLLNFYILVAVILEVLGQYFKIFYLQILKPLPIILMIFYIHSKNSNREHLVAMLVKYGLGFSLIGDIFLMQNEDISFMVGTGFFVIGHVIYIIAFGMGEEIRELGKYYSKLRKLGYLIIVSLLCGNCYSLWQQFPNKPLFVFYGIILAVQAIYCLKRYELTTNSSFYFIIIGVVFFSVSDNLLAFLKFNRIKTDLGRAVIMFTYYTAQYFIMHGALHQSNLQKQIDSYYELQKRN